MHHFMTINWLGVLVAAGVGFILGGLWYSPMLFAKAWMEENGYTEEYIQQNGHPAKAMVIAFITVLIQATILAFMLSQLGITSVLVAAKISLIIGVFIVGLSYYSDAQFNMKSTRLVLIEAGFRATCITLMGVILALF